MLVVHKRTTCDVAYHLEAKPECGFIGKPREHMLGVVAHD